ncbi:serine hydrolase [Bradyrhizobium jicamae]|uniref:serine hydrolase domain-containing protein n=1 Tax=Bradyrhizobium jicamae TaxID=280332 RepID=UPI001BA86DD6|nr:serine hydrolase [Bradyrhizobium jicamae]MBR0937178.1 serine hydrolase [Bradyrhizobium jicamae]
MKQFSRRNFLAIAAAAAARPGFARTMNEDIGERLSRSLETGKVSGLHALLVSQGGNTVFEYYGRGEDQIWGRPLGTVVFAPDVLHDLRSVSKSVVGLAYGIALAAGKVPAPEAKLYEQFPEYADLAGQAGRDRITLHHVLSMTLGLEWDELTIPYGDLRNSENAMEAAPDRFRFILERPIVGEPGAKWTYCGGATALLGHLIARGTGEPLLNYCRRVLFDPMGFGPAEWTTGHDGEPHTASGLRLLPRDLLKVGQLVQAGGKWNGREIVPSDWVKRVTTPVVTIDPNRSYGYHWYMGDGQPPRQQHWIGGIGWGGQRLYVIPGLDLVGAINCGNYGKPGQEQSRVSTTVLSDVVLPSFLS